MQELFHRDQRSRELRDIRARVPKVRDEIARLEAYLGEAPTGGATEATQTALQLRAVLTRGELEGLRTELSTLLRRQAELDGGTPASRPPALAESVSAAPPNAAVPPEASPVLALDHEQVVAKAMLDTLAMPSNTPPSRLASRRSLEVGGGKMDGAVRSQRRNWVGVVGTAVIGMGLLLLGYTAGFVGGRQSVVVPVATAPGIAAGLPPSPVPVTRAPVATSSPAPVPTALALIPAPAVVEVLPPVGAIAAPHAEVDDESPEDESPASQVLGSTVVVVPALRLRAAPTLVADLAGLLGFGTELQILNDSVEADDYEWLAVRTPDGVEGWVVVNGVSAAR